MLWNRSVLQHGNENERTLRNGSDNYEDIP